MSNTMASPCRWRGGFKGGTEMGIGSARKSGTNSDKSVVQMQFM